MTTTYRTWRAEPVKSARTGAVTSWRLIAGRAAERVRLPLGSVTEEVAGACAEAMNEEERATWGTPRYDRVLRLADEEVVQVEDPSEDDPHTVTIGGVEAVVRFLSGDPLVADVFGTPPVDYSAMTLREYHERVFWPVRCDASSVIGVAASTAAAEAVLWKNKGEGRGILDGPLGSTRLRDLTDVAWEAWMTAQPVSPRSKALRRAAYAALLSYARRVGHLSYKPEFFAIKGSTKVTRPPVEPLTLDELLRLLDVADPMRRAMWSLGAGVGLRPGELVRVHWEDVDLEARTIKVRGTKTEESAATIPLTPLAHRELLRWHLACGRPTSGPAFTHHGEMFVDFKHSLATDAKKAKIARHITRYTLRASFATISWSLGVDLDVARRILRHTDQRMLLEVYARPRPAEILAKLAGFDFGASEDQQFNLLIVRTKLSCFTY